MLMWIALFAAGIWAGTQNALAGGGSFVTLPTLILSGLDARSANITSTIALFPGQVTTGLAGRKLVSGAERLSFKALFVISLIGGVLREECAALYYGPGDDPPPEEQSHI